MIVTNVPKGEPFWRKHDLRLRESTKKFSTTVEKANPEMEKRNKIAQMQVLDLRNSTKNA